MTYIPSNKIKTNIFTNGSELKIKSTGKEYIGPYWQKYTGEMFTGKTPKDKPSRVLIPIIKAKDFKGIKNTKTSFSYMNIDDANTRIVAEYLNINQIKQINQTKNLPTQFYPIPDQQDYNFGSLQRYFCVKTNENAYIEIDKETYSAISTQKVDWLWELYTPFKFMWVIKGDEKEVEQTNYNITILQEQRLKRVGLKEFLRNDYLKFFK